MQALLAGGADPNGKGKVSLGNVNFAHALVRSLSAYACVQARTACVLVFVIAALECACGV